MSKLVVELDDFVDAARSMRHEVAENVELCLSAIAGRSQPELVGADPAGLTWATDYDTAARTVLAATAQLANSAYRTSQLFAASGHNYATAEHASTTGQTGHTDHTDHAGQAGCSGRTGGGSAMPGPEWTPLLADHPHIQTPHIPSAGGAGHDTPADWWIIEHTIGVLWPGGHQDRLRATADTWRSAARGLDHALGIPLAITARFIIDHLPEADDIRRVCTTLYDRTTTLTDTYRTLAESCDTYATHLDTCHRAVEDELTALTRDSAITQTAGAALSFVSFGLAEIPTQAAQAARITTAANRIRHLITTLTTAATAITTTLTRITGIAHDIHNALRELTTTRIAYAGITNTPNLRRIQHTEAIAQNAERGTRARAATDGTVSMAKGSDGLAHISDPRKFDPQALRGLSGEEIEAVIPAGWTRTAARRGAGVKFQDPVNRGRQIRIMRPYAPNTRSTRISEGPYAVVSQNGHEVKIPLKGNAEL